MLRVLHVIETIAPQEGGPPRVAAGLAVAQSAVGIDAHILCGDGRSLPDYLQYWQAHVPGFPSANVHTAASRSDNLIARAMALRAWVQANLRNFDVIHVHQLWRLVPTIVASACGRLRVPYLIAPHTSLSPWALAQKRSKKMLARWLSWDRIFKGAAGFHALNELEAQEIRDGMGRHGPPVFVVPNGVLPAEFVALSGEEPSALSQLLSPPDGPKPFILFLARLHTMKGPDLLLDAFGSLLGDHPELQLALAGPDFGMREMLQRRAAQLRLTQRVHFLGLVSGSDRRWLLRTALCLSQPSRDEGFSLSILEAMANSCPVVISDRCKFPEVGRHGAGLIVPLSVPELAAALHVYASDPARRSADGRAARLLIERDYTWEKVARQTQRMYSEALGARRDMARSVSGRS